MKIKKIIILGSTGSIGINTLDVIRGLGSNYDVVGLSAGRNIGRFIKQIKEFSPKIVVLGDESRKREFENKLKSVKHKPLKVLYGMQGLITLARYRGANFLISALVGSVGLIPTLEAIKSGKDIALANKEALVVAGDIITENARKYGVKILPLDSEHSAVFQCLQGADIRSVKKIILTASGGPFYRYPDSRLRKVSVQEALNHPTWQMGEKVTVDSANLMNKGLEIIEAHHLFGMDIDKIDVLIHAQSVIHSLVEFIDGSVLAQMGIPDMRVPIQYALTYPERKSSKLRCLSLSEYGKLTFEKPDFTKFPCLELALRAAGKGGTMPVVLNAANEVAVQAFLSGKISFPDIPVIVRSMMDKHKITRKPSLEVILQTDKETRDKVYSVLLERKA